jgi:hypothetical protein
MTGLEKGPLDAGIGPAQYCRFPGLISAFFVVLLGTHVQAFEKIA